MRPSASLKGEMRLCNSFTELDLVGDKWIIVWALQCKYEDHKSYIAANERLFVAESISINLATGDLRNDNIKVEIIYSPLKSSTSCMKSKECDKNEKMFNCIDKDGIDSHVITTGYKIKNPQ